MKKYDEYEKTEAFTGEFEQLSPGGYICKIMKVTCEEKPYGQLLRIAFDIAEGPHKGFYKRLFDRKKETNPEAKWQGMLYQTVKESDLRFFKGFITSIESSNKGFKWDWDEQKLVGKLFGGVFGQEEYLDGNEEVRLSTKCRFVRSVGKIKEGINIPEIKRLNPGDKTTKPEDGFTTVVNDDDFPF